MQPLTFREVLLGIQSLCLRCSEARPFYRTRSVTRALSIDPLWRRVFRRVPPRRDWILIARHWREARAELRRHATGAPPARHMFRPCFEVAFDGLRVVLFEVSLGYGRERRFANFQ